MTRWRPLLAAMLGLVPASAAALDTGHHFDLTRSVLQERGFESAAIEAVQVLNWFTDYYAASPAARDALRAELGKLHADNLYATADVARYWGWLLANARQATRAAAERDDPLAALAVLGVSLHAVQDFYAHSNWVDLHRARSGEPYRCETWLAGGPPDREEVFTGSYPPYPSTPLPGHPEHGGYDMGLNKDAHVRPLWDEAYVFAYCATQEWVELAQGWANEAASGFWDRVRGYRAGPTVRRQLDRDLEAARLLSLWVVGKGSQGHWKGGESGSAKYLSVKAVEWTSAPASPFVHQLRERRRHEELTPHLYDGEPPPPFPAVTSGCGPATVVDVGITYVAERRGGGRRVDRGRNADLFAVTTVGGQRYVDRVLRNQQRSINPWHTLHLASGSPEEIPVRLEVWDQDETLGRADEMCDLHPAAGRKALELRVRVADGRLHGDIQGLYDNPERTFEISGAAPDGLPVLVRGFVRTRRVGDRPLSVSPGP